MSNNLCYMSGYGIEIEDLLPLLNDDTKNKWDIIINFRKYLKIGCKYNWCTYKPKAGNPKRRNN